ncbi:hypothetical protein [Advenella alkanexedens]|uniref:hypothetical protein n=1 Tax=Advenella alkanexedens TaxID=1481665 RepID=UPI0026759400|nr:hypothetical protein [Advenella alkanexedens]WKU18653.1 hypothetical protein Q3V95_10105 [Advenella alkanexedens]
MKKSVLAVLFIGGVSLFLSGCKEDKQPERDAVQELAEIMLSEREKAEERYNYEMCTIDAMIAKKDIDETCGKK